MKPHELTGHEAFCLSNADHFVACRGRSAAGRTRATFPTLAEAETYAAAFGDRRTMVYAVTAEGRSAHIKNA
jgi:hypothetical protein